MMGFTQELKEVKMVSQRIRLSGVHKLPTLITYRASWSGSQQSVKVVTMAKQMSIRRTDMALRVPDDDAEPELLPSGIT